MAGYLSISRPTNDYWMKGNWRMFCATPAALLCYRFIPSDDSEIYMWLICGVFGFISARFGLEALLLFRDDHRIRAKYKISQQPSNTAYDSRWATPEEMEAAGFYDGRGRVIGLDLDGNPLFIPHILKPPFTSIVAASGAGKTSCFCVASCILSLFTAW